MLKSLRMTLPVPLLVGLGLTALLQAGTVLGDSTAPAWTFEHTAQRALATHPAILSQQYASAAASAELKSASWQRYPTPSLQATKQNNDRSSQSSTVLSLQQPLWTGGRITANIESAESRLNASEAVVLETQESVLLSLIDNFTEALRLQARQEFAFKNVHDHENLLNLVNRRVDQQVTPPVDLNLAQARLYQATNDLASISQELANAVMRISHLAGKNIGNLAPIDTDTSSLPRSEKDALRQAEHHSPTLARLAFEEEIASAEISAKKSVYLPQIDLVYQKITDSSYIPSGSLPGDSLMLMMKMQPGSGLSSVSGVSSAASRRQAIRLNRDAALRDLQINISTDWNILTGARLRFENSTTSGKISDDVFESYVRQYTIGRKGWLEVLNAAQEASHAKMAAADAAAQINRSTLRLRLMTGNLNIAPTTN